MPVHCSQTKSSLLSLVVTALCYLASSHLSDPSHLPSQPFLTLLRMPTLSCCNYAHAGCFSEGLSSTTQSRGATQKFLSYHSSLKSLNSSSLSEVKFRLLSHCPHETISSNGTGFYLLSSHGNTSSLNDA